MMNVKLGGLVLVTVGSACIARPTLESLPELTFTDVTTGQDHACGITDAGDVYCWSRLSPRALLVSDGIVFQSVSTYWDHTCGVATDGAGYCWGQNALGQLGTDTAGMGRCRIPGSFESAFCARTPQPVAANLTFSSIDVGAAHSCGLTDAGDVWCWGANGDGQLGTTPADPCESSFLSDNSRCSFFPVRVAGPTAFTSVSTGLAHTCAIDDLAQAWCWGLGSAGRLGNGSTNSEDVPTLVNGGLAWRSVAAGGSHTCGVSTGGTGYCWGSNADLQAGSNDFDLGCGGTQIFRCLWAPRPVSGGLRFTVITPSDAVPVGGDGPRIGGHSCGLTTANSVFCWGLNSSGQLVNHNDLRSARPIALTRNYRFATISAGLENTCGITTELELLCWADGGPTTSYWVFNR